MTLVKRCVYPTYSKLCWLYLLYDVIHHHQSDLVIPGERLNVANGPDNWLYKRRLTPYPRTHNATIATLKNKVIIAIVISMLFQHYADVLIISLSYSFCVPAWMDEMSII